MFRYTLTLLTIFLVLNLQLNIATARSFEEVQQHRGKLQKRNEAEASLEPHSRHKRSWGTALKAAAGFSYAVTIGSTIYTQIKGCDDFKPDPCKSVPCQYYTACPKVCQTPDKNNDLITSEKVAISTLLDEMDETQLNVFSLAWDSASASISNEIIFQQIDEINDKVDRIMFTYAQLDRNVSEEFVKQSKEIQSKLQDYTLSLDDVVGSEMDSIFDKWTWEGTGLFALSVALPIGVAGVQYLRRRFAIDKLYTEMKNDFLARKLANVQGGTNAKAFQRDYWIKYVDEPEVKARLTSSAKTLYYSQQAQQQLSKWTARLDASFTAIGVALSIFVLWQQYSSCKTMANDLQDSAYKIVEQHEEIFKLKETEVDPLWIGVQNEAWPRVKELMTNESTLLWLDEIRNLTLGAENVNTTTANTIQYFMDNIEAADVQTTINLQNDLIVALKSIKYKYDCLGDKLIAIRIVIRDCEAGDDTFENLYDEVAVGNNMLNRDDCVNDEMVPYTSIDEFRGIVEKWAEHEGWYSNCLLNSDSLLKEVCAEFQLKGYTEPAEIVTQVNNTYLTADMVTNMLTRCPDPEITPTARDQTCLFYCLYQTVSEIAESVALMERQVESIILDCSICDVSANERQEICEEYYCKSKNATDVAEEMKIPSATVEYIVANNCSNCIIHDQTVQQSICDDNKCKDISASEIASTLGVPEYAVTDVIAECDTIMPEGCGEVDEETKNQVIFLCSLGVTAELMKNNGLVDLPIETIQSIIDESGCAPSG